MAKMERERVVHLLNEAIDVLYDMFGKEWCVRWGIDQGLSDEEICDWIYDDMELIVKIRKEMEEEENAG